MAYEQILVDIKNGVATITLNRPEKLNAYTAQMGAELHRAFAELDENDDARVIVVTGAGRAFCAGADLSARGGATFDRRDQPNAAATEPHTIRPWNMKNRSSRPSMVQRSALGSRCRCNGTFGSLPKARELVSCSCAAA